MDISEQVAQKVRAAIESGALAPGEKLPGEKEMARLFGVCDKTIRTAYGRLADKGLVYRKRPRGTFVASAPLLAGARQGKLIRAVLHTAGKKDEFWTDFLRGMSMEAHRHGFDVALKECPHSTLETYDRQIEMACEGTVSGVLLYPYPEFTAKEDFYRQLADKDIPVMAFNYGKDLGLEAVAADEALGIALVVRHLYALGHRRIGYLEQGTPKTIWHIEERRAAFFRTCAELELTVQPDHVWSVVHAARSEIIPDPEWRQQCQDLLRSEGLPTAIVCYNDLLAVALWAAAEDVGLSVPDELSITGFDNSLFGQSWTHSVTTVDQERTEIGTLAVRRLIARIEGRPQGGMPRCILVKPKLIVRSSAARPRPSGSLVAR